MSNKPFLTLMHDDIWRIVLAKEISPGTAKMWRSLDRMTIQVIKTVPHNEEHLPYLIARLNQIEKFPVDFSYIFGSYDEGELAEAFKMIGAAMPPLASTT